MPYANPEKRKEYDRIRNRTLERKMAKKARRDTVSEEQINLMKKKRRAYYLTHREAALKNAKEHAEKNRAKIKIYRRAYKNSTKAFLANITNEEYDRIVSSCVVCGFSFVVDLHHKDGNHCNNDIENLVGLCPNHHFMIHRRKIKFDDLLRTVFTNEDKGCDQLIINGFCLSGDFADKESFKKKIDAAKEVRAYAQTELAQ